MVTLSRIISTIVAASLLLALAPASGAAQNASHLDQFVGEWTYSDQYSTTYLRITDAGKGRCRFVEGFLYQGRIEWRPSIDENGNAIYLRSKRGTLVGAFDSSSFRATHGHVIRYTIKIALRRDGKMTYTVGGILEDPHVVTKVR